MDAAGNLTDAEAASGLVFLNTSPFEENQAELSNSWERSVDVHLGHRIPIDKVEFVPTKEDYSQGVGRETGLAIVPRWLTKDPSRPGAYKDYSSVLSGRHTRKAQLTSAGTIVASFVHQPDEPTFKLDKFGHHQIKQWCKEILQMEKKPKECYLCFDLVKMLSPSDSKFAVIRRNILVYKTILKGYRISKAAAASAPSLLAASATGRDSPPSLAVNGSLLQPAGNASPKSPATIYDDESSFDESQLAPAFANLRKCLTDRSEPLFWSKFETYLSRAHPESFDDVFKWKLAPVIEKSWFFHGGNIRSVVSFDQLKRAAMWAEPDCGNFGVFVDILACIFVPPSPSFTYTFCRDYTEAISKLQADPSLLLLFLLVESTPRSLVVIQRRSPQELTEIEVVCINGHWRLRSKANPALQWASIGDIAKEVISASRPALTTVTGPLPHAQSTSFQHLATSLAHATALANAGDLAVSGPPAKRVKLFD